MMEPGDNRDQGNGTKRRSRNGMESNSLRRASGRRPRTTEKETRGGQRGRRHEHGRKLRSSQAGPAAVQPSSSFWFFALMQVLYRSGHRRRVLRDLLGSRRAHVGPHPGPGRPLHQRQLLDRDYGGSTLSIVLLDPDTISQFWGWRIAFGLGVILGIGVLLIRRYVPERPRWLATHGRNDEARSVYGVGGQ